jgi:hypothetical protein
MLRPRDEEAKIGETMRSFVIHSSAALLAAAFVGLASARANAQVDQEHRQTELVSPSWGIAPGETVSISVVVYANRTVATNDPVIARIQLLDTEGEAIAESDQIQVEPGKTRSWDVPRERLPAGERTGRIQVRARILVTTPALSRPPSLAATAELFDSTTRRASVFWIKFRIRQEFPVE